MGGATAILGVELCAPLLMLCWLCCWPDDGNSDTSSGKHPKKPVITNGYKKQPLSAHRSHEEIRSRRKSHHENREDDNRYHSAPSIIDEVVHRRDWERSTKDLHIPLNPVTALSSNTLAPNYEQIVNVGHVTHSKHKSDEEIIGRPCKKHYTNIKTSRNKKSEAPETSRKELTADDIKDEDVSELTSNVSNFYIGDSSCMLNKENIREDKEGNAEDRKRFKGKDVKQSLNESIKFRDRPRNILGPLTEFQVSGVFEMEDPPDIDRSGAVHHFEERSNYCDTPSVPYSPLPVEGTVSPIAPLAMGAGEGGEGGGSRRRLRGRHASAGDVLAPALRPHSAALSESDLDFDLECCDEPPPAYDELQMIAISQRKETAI
ncbi:unnamed protein product [Parnassius apollo]|uniref:(apollo) hypothetical protein n=1 Tax=Parnassius apollo TaxID=110799 RepID=A0A8S3X7L3_PARAO|nr:unnamed protein product [Parnassius apollo]